MLSFLYTANSFWLIVLLHRVDCLLWDYQCYLQLSVVNSFSMTELFLAYICCTYPRYAVRTCIFSFYLQLSSSVYWWNSALLKFLSLVLLLNYRLLGYMPFHDHWYLHIDCRKPHHVYFFWSTLSFLVCFHSKPFLDLVHASSGYI